MNWPELLSSLVRREDQPVEATAWAMGQILGGEATAKAVYSNGQ